MMNTVSDTASSHAPEPRRVGVWAEATHIEAKEFVIGKKSPESSDDIPTIPDLDDLQDIFDKEIAVPPVVDKRVTETARALAEVGGGSDGDPALEALLAQVPQVPLEVSDTVWTVDSLITMLADEMQDVNDG